MAISAAVATAADAAEDIHLGRQSILDRRFELHAFELLLRMRSSGGSDVVDNTEATATVIARTLNELGIENVLGRFKGFINVDEKLLMSDEIELLPPRKIGLEILETVRVDDALVARCTELKKHGFTLSLDDFPHTDPSFEPLLPIVDHVKIDLLQTPSHELPKVVKRLRQWPVSLVAEKVSTQEEASRCLDLGFELFQGYFFAKPKILSGKRLSTSETTLLRLLGLVIADADISEIVKVLKQDPGLVTALLRMANSAAAAPDHPLTSLSQVIIMLGRKQLQRWLQLLTYARHTKGAVFPSPLLQLAATRGKLMELLAEDVAPKDKSFADRAFMTGILSLLDALLGKPLAEVTALLNLPSDVNTALLEHSGKLGDMLTVVESLEDEGIDSTACYFRLGHLSDGKVTAAHVAALRWANTLGD
ncbi:MAG: EAL and HDOD domain-containing protein [Burkholderiales bacterium]